eukprot:TRINITY_DN112102_c0_g1_i1.p1 TRINITY_DN112102_c0_g1~~TRINITY_DN112102_c0_g1_i1.p1  ORF type:complete len:365 (+),score=75.87 TRINITY_DN112102_c0_g1_i1:69-1163(+)
MAPLVRLLYGVSAVAVPVVLILLSLYIYCFVKTRQWRKTRIKGKNEETVEHAMPMELYSSPLTSHVDSQRIRACLLEKNIEFTEHSSDHGELGTYECLKAEILKVNKHAETVLLIHDGHPVVQVDEIMAYIDQTFDGLDLLPRGMEDRLKAIRWMQFATPCKVTLGALNKDEKDSLKNHPTLATCVQVLSQPLFCELDNMLRASTVFQAIFKHPNKLMMFFLWLQCAVRFIWPTPKVAVAQATKAAIAGIVAILEELERDLEDGREYIVGPLCIADIMVATELNRLELMGVLDPLATDFRNVREYWSRMKRRKGFSESYRPRAETPAAKQAERSMAAFRKTVHAEGLVAAYKLEETNAEEEEET